jgi:hypothetical protein
VWGFNKGCLYIPESVGKTWKDNLEVPQPQNINELPPKRIRNRMKYSWVCVCVLYIYIYLFIFDEIWQTMILTMGTSGWFARISASTSSYTIPSAAKAFFSPSTFGSWKWEERWRKDSLIKTIQDHSKLYSKPCPTHRKSSKHIKF